MQVDPLSLGFLATVVLVGGVVALIADRLGRTLGKKRLSFWRLRPRHTAELFTVLAGLAIPLVTVLFIMAVSRDVRQWIFEGRRAIERAQTLQGDIQNLEAKIEDAEKVRIRLEDQVKEREKRVTDLTRSEKEAKEATAKAREESAKLVAQRSKLEADYRRSSAQLVTVGKELSKRRSELSALQGRLVRLEAAGKVVADQREEILRRNTELIQQITKLERDEENLTERLAQLTADLDAKQTQISEKEREISEAQARYQRVVDEYKTDIDRLNAEAASARRDLEYAQAMINAFVNVSRVRPMVFSRGDELARIAVPARLTEDEAREALRDVLANARAVASQRGAKPIDGIEAGFAAIPLESGVVTVAEQEAEVIRTIIGRTEQAVIIATALFNAFQEEFVPLRVTPHDNPLVYRTGQIVAETRIDGTQAEDNILAQIQRFLEERVSQKVRDDKMIPMYGRASLYGEVSPDQMLAVVRQIRNANRAVRLVAFAEEDTRAGDRLKLGFRLR